MGTKKETVTATTATVVEKCASKGCKSSAHRFSFCDEHYEHFKFGLIKKTGEQVSDYEKKFGHYQAYKKGHVQKAA
jgi:hypothetical protein